VLLAASQSRMRAKLFRADAEHRESVGDEITNSRLMIPEAVCRMFAVDVPLA